MSPPGSDLSPGTAPTSPAPSSSPSSAPSSSPPSPSPSSRSPSPSPDRRPPPTNPRAERRLDRWQDGRTEDSQWLAAQRERRAASEQPPSRAPGRDTPPGATPGEQPQPGEKPLSVERDEHGRYRFGEIALSETELRDLLQHKASEDSRRATLPSDPSGYELKLPDNFVTPAGIEFSFNEDDPRARLAREFALEAGLSQEQFQKLIAIDAARQVEEIAAFNRMVNAEVKKLGATGTQRVTAIQNFLRGSLGDELARPFVETLVSERMVKGWETIIDRITHQGAGSFSHAGRDAPESSNGRIAGYENMSFEQRLAAAEASKRDRR
jgi:hypothetical protein